ncbi:phenylpropionate dioxygenase-like ring-hydroxylating dioxygenase large terminal subunit [Actinomadura namibiensis]|uniref:Phenylpropionate dioxygenase-like ring-hydroxylating dioxygenase large terminal subunit n=1 Tax=Actinomadura namibiensis TaxID=182080 RepID=A0A7W3QNL1_ACTNM|nr:phenylpropionate dioxygenase-like ring-hydroxylating dioxygenase large terminal subunit [Actinomadura namibiensis]
MLMPPALLDGLDPQEVAEEQTAAATAVNEEDRIGLEAVQRAVGSRFAGRGHLSPKEPGVQLFYRALAEALVQEGTPGRE